MENMQGWRRFECEGQPIYIHPEKPDWFVPNDQADILLQALSETGDIDQGACIAKGAGMLSLSERLIALARLGSQLTTETSAPYTGRARHLSLSALKECWFHLTNTCNLACRHCLFGASPSASETLPRETLAQGMAEAKQLGCTLFYFTGGEPFVYPDFPSILKQTLAEPEVHAVVLTNGMLIDQHIDSLKALPKERLHLQISLDGLEKSHEHLRGSGTFQRLVDSLKILRDQKIPATLSVAVNRANVAELPEIVGFAAEQGVRNIHFLWHFIRGKGSRDQFVPPLEILPLLIKAHQTAEAKGITIDNVETMKSQVFSTPGTRYDLSNTAWGSVAIGPDGAIYPSPALIGIDELHCGRLKQGLDTVWRQSPVLERVRQTSLIDHPAYRNNPLKFLIGGGDIDHSYLAGGEFTGHDPYVELYNGLALWLVSNQAKRYRQPEKANTVLKMGDVRFDCPDGGRDVSLTHCNCVISLSGDRGHSSVREFYAGAATAANEEIVNPFAPAQAEAAYIPDDSKKRSYGCGSPVNDAEVQPEEVLVDLGSGSGVECFMAADAVGPNGRVYGIDMTDEMLVLARTSKKAVTDKLGYDNVEFIKGFLEDIPLPEKTADVVISNCVINLSPDKRQTFHEVFRILKPGGRLVISDIVTDEPIPVEIKNNDKFRGECLGGALQQEDLMAMLRAAGFGGIRLIKRFPYRQEGETLFYSLTYCAFKPEPAQEVEVIYRGPFAAVCTESGIMLLKGKRTKISVEDAKSLDDSVFVLNSDGAVANIRMENSCCAPAPQPSIVPLGDLKQSLGGGGCCGTDAQEKGNPKIVPLAPQPPAAEQVRHQAGCMVCGCEITYLQHEEEGTCYYCGGTKKTNTLCVHSHFICDDCHQQDGLSAIRLLCTETKEQDMLALLKKIRQHPSVPMHGPEHHAMVPGIILATYRNRGGKIGKEAILGGIERGSKVPGGVCGFWGNCGAATGVGIAFSVLLDATPLTPKARQLAQKITARVLDRIAEIKGGRCCQRETVNALKEAARISREILPVLLLAEEEFECNQFAANKECIRKLCPMWQEGSEASGTE